MLSLITRVTPWAVGFACLLLLLAFPRYSSAATFTVTSSADSGAGTLREAVGFANASPVDDIIDFAANLAGSTITLTSNDATATGIVGPTALGITTTGATTITGNPALAGITISGDDARRVFYIDAGATLQLQYLTIDNGRAQGGNGGSNIQGGGGGAAGMGGGVFVRQGGTLEVFASTFSNNTAYRFRLHLDCSKLF